MEKTIKTTLRLPESLHRDIVEMCHAHDRPLNAEVKRILREAVSTWRAVESGGRPAEGGGALATYDRVTGGRELRQ